MASRPGTSSLQELEKQYASGEGEAPARGLDRLRRERERVERMLEFDRAFRSGGAGRLAGVDEVGIGPMAGPVVAAAVVLPPGVWIDGVDDSKRIQPERREALDACIRAAALDVGLGLVETEEVDRLNVYHAGLRAMRLAVQALGAPPDCVLVDSRTIPDLPVPQHGFDRGDGLSFAIACASIVAKVHRDRLMTALDLEHPGYGFARHKGYCSPAHQEAVRRLGPCPIHRRSYDFIRELCGEYDARFYALQQDIERVKTPAALEAWETRFREAVRAGLPAAERRKLRLMATRRRQRFTRPSGRA